MSRKTKYSYETKKEAVVRCLSGESSLSEEARQFGINRAQLREWISKYQSLG
ncbi:MAG: transposase, partial [Clostridiales bacterium]|nr:transposase [Clostridiales bacterium]